MNTNSGSAFPRFLRASAFALPMTVALLFLMTQLILPLGGDPVVEKMIRNLELRRATSANEIRGGRVSESRPTFEDPSLTDTTNDKSDLPTRPSRSVTEADSIPEKGSEHHVVDWWAAAQEVVQDADDAAFDEWLIRQGRKKYVSIMQGPMPTSGAPAATSTEDEIGTSYRNVYGEIETKISENCVMQMRSNIFAWSNFERNRPALVVCKPKRSLKLDFSSLRRKQPQE